MSNDIIKKYEAVALSDKDISKLLEHQNKVVLYPNLYKYQNIDEVLGPNGMCTLLFESKPKYGHWVCLWKFDKETVSFFNSYDGYPDDTLRYIEETFRVKTHQNFTYLSKLLYTSPYELTYNDEVYQKKGKNIKTCGRHCVVRLWARDLDDDQYDRYIQSYILKYSLKDADELVTLLTMNPSQAKRLEQLTPRLPKNQLFESTESETESEKESETETESETESEKEIKPKSKLFPRQKFETKETSETESEDELLNRLESIRGGPFPVSEKDAMDYLNEDVEATLKNISPYISPYTTPQFLSSYSTPYSTPTLVSPKPEAEDPAWDRFWDKFGNEEAPARELELEEMLQSFTYPKITAYPKAIDLDRLMAKEISPKEHEENLQYINKILQGSGQIRTQNQFRNYPKKLVGNRTIKKKL